jgi:hypothetical protein
MLLDTNTDRPTDRQSYHNFRFKFNKEECSDEVPPPGAPALSVLQRWTVSTHLNSLHSAGQSHHLESPLCQFCSDDQSVLTSTLFTLRASPTAWSPLFVSSAAMNSQYSPRLSPLCRPVPPPGVPSLLVLQRWTVSTHLNSLHSAGQSHHLEPPLCQFCSDEQSVLTSTLSTLRASPTPVSSTAMSSQYSPRLSPLCGPVPPPGVPSLSVLQRWLLQYRCWRL